MEGSVWSTVGRDIIMQEHEQLQQQQDGGTDIVDQNYFSRNTILQRGLPGWVVWSTLLCIVCGG